MRIDDVRRPRECYLQVRIGTFAEPLADFFLIWNGGIAHEVRAYCILKTFAAARSSTSSLL